MNFHYCSFKILNGKLIFGGVISVGVLCRMDWGRSLRNNTILKSIFMLISQFECPCYLPLFIYIHTQITFNILKAQAQAPCRNDLFPNWPDEQVNGILLVLLSLRCRALGGFWLLILKYMFLWILHLLLRRQHYDL